MFLLFLKNLRKDGQIFGALLFDPVTDEIAMNEQRKQQWTIFN